MSHKPKSILSKAALQEKKRHLDQRVKGLESSIEKYEGHREELDGLFAGEPNRKKREHYGELLAQLKDELDGKHRPNSEGIEDKSTNNSDFDDPEFSVLPAPSRYSTPSRSSSGLTRLSLRDDEDENSDDQKEPRHQLGKRAERVRRDIDVELYGNEVEDSSDTNDSESSGRYAESQNISVPVVEDSSTSDYDSEDSTQRVAAYRKYIIAATDSRRNRLKSTMSRRDSGFGTSRRQKSEL